MTSDRNRPKQDQDPENRTMMNRRRFHRSARNLGASILLALPFLGRWFGVDSASARTPREQLTEKFGSDVTVRGQDKFVDDIISRQPPEDAADNTVQLAQNSFSRAYNRFGRAYNRFSRAYNRFSRR